MSSADAAREPWTWTPWRALTVGALVAFAWLLHVWWQWLLPPEDINPVPWASAVIVGCVVGALYVGKARMIWRMATVPLVVVSLLALPPFDEFKWLGPWMAYRGELARLQQASDAAADRLHIPVGKTLTQAELDAWSAAAPLRLQRRYPLVGVDIAFSVVNPWGPKRMPYGHVWAWWANDKNPSFGDFDYLLMRVLSSSN
jgi:hypothetical protein